MSIPLKNIKIRHHVEVNVTKIFNFIESRPHYSKILWTVWEVDKFNYKVGDPLSYMYSVDIEDSIHYNAIKTNDYDIYNDLMHVTKQKEHTEENFKNLIQSWDENKCEKINLDYDGKVFTVTDGVHRLSAMKHLGLITNSLPLKYVNITYEPNTVNEIEKLLKETTGIVHYNGWNNRTTYGYHSLNIFNINFEGQRNPSKRLEIMRKYYDFTNKKVIDLGCNSGGMLLHLFEIDSGIGFDFDSKCIDSANKITKLLGLHKNLKFDVLDLEKADIASVFQEIKPDCIFLLSLGSWIKNWTSIYKSAVESKATIFLEVNNNNEGVPQLKLFSDMGCKILKISESSDDDITNNRLRAMYMIEC
jgi:hypothetical protein